LYEREAEAARLRALRASLAQDHRDRLGLWLAEMVEHFLIGATIAVPIGYASHLVLDAGSARGLPPI